MSTGKSNPLTRDQIVQINAICNRFERAWQNGQPPAIEAVAAGSDSLIRSSLLQHLAELDIQCRVSRGADIDLTAYLVRWPDLDRVALQAALEAAQKTGTTSLLIRADSASAATGRPQHQPCSVDQFLARLRESRLLAEHEIDTFVSAASAEMSTASLATMLVEGRRLTSFQVTTLLENRGDPLTLGEYMVQDFVGRGGMGTVYRAIHRRMKRTVAIKVLRQDIPHADIVSRRFLREVEVAAKLCHPNIVTAYDAGEQNGISYLVSEFVEGQNLGDLVRQYGPMSLPLAVDIVQQAARALSYAHGEGVIHRDIKPSNLLLDDAGNVKLLDVGLARINSPELPDNDATSDLTTTGMIMGTVDYMSPEQAQNTRLADERSDVYSLGCTLYFLVTGRAPFAKGTAMERLLAHREQPVPLFRSLSPLIPQTLDDVLKSTLAKNPAERMPSMDELVRQLDTIKATGLPDITLSLSAAEDEFVAPAGQNTDVGPTLQAEPPDLTTSESPATEVASPSLATDSADTLAASVFPDLRMNEQPGSALHRKPTASQAAILPWVLIPGLLATALLAWYFRPVDDVKPLPGPGSNGPAVATLTELSEEDIQSYRKAWAAALNSPEEQTIERVTFVLIPPGRFLYGDGDAATEMTMETEYYLSDTEITVGQFRDFVEATNNYQTVAERNDTGWGKKSGEWIQGPGYSWKNPGENAVTDTTPAASIAYPDAIAWCKWFSAKSRRTVRLPREEEWEYACRCGRRGRWSFGDDPALIDRYAWTRNNSEQQIRPVKGLLPNAWGLYDMHGNEFEWCFAENAQAPEFAGTGPMRGGGFASLPENTTSSSQFQSELNQPTRGAFRILMERQD